jgi:hypothetical protein
MEEKMRSTRGSKAISILVVAAFLVGAAAAENHKHCQAVGGMLMTNLGAIDANTTMGTVTGDLRGAVGATILSTEAHGTTLILNVQHHWVTESGDTIKVAPATATTTAVNQSGLYAIVSYPIQIIGGTGKFAELTGQLNSIGEADLSSGMIVLRYFGQLCSEKGED